MVVLIQNGKEKFNNRREADVYFLYKRLLKVGFSDSMAVRIMISDNQALRCCKSHYFCLLGTQFESLYDGLKSFGGEKKSEHIEAESMASEPTLTHKGYR
jgi:glycosylphosphatidylinositol transamidase (GPIT) subunit GPI8